MKISEARKKESTTEPFEPVHFRVSSALMDKIRAAAKKDRRTISNMINILLEDAISLKERQSSK